MAQTNAAVVSFNGGVFGGLLSARTDIESYRSSAAVMANWLPHAQGPMSRRPGMRFVDVFADSANKGRLFSFEFSVLQNYLILGMANQFSLYLDDGRVDVPSVTATIANGDFANVFTSWTDISIAPATVSVVAEQAVLDAQTGGTAAFEQQVTINEQTTEHVLQFDVVRGEVEMRVGTTSGGVEITEFTRLGTGSHRLSFTPNAASVFIGFRTEENTQRIIDNVSFVPAGPLSVPHPYSETELTEVHTAQKGDILYFSHRSFKTRKLERRGGLSWSFVEFSPPDGPYGTPNTTKTTLTPSGISGNITLTASEPIFDAGHVGTTFQLSAAGQITEATAAAANVFTEPIKVVGVGDPSRRFTVVQETTAFTGKITLQRSFGNTNSFVKFREWNRTNLSSTFTVDIVDSNDNQIVFYRLAVLPGDFTSGTVVMRLEYTGGTSSGATRITGFTSPTVVDAEVTDQLGSTDATDIWSEGAWSDLRGYPNAITFFRQRLWFARGITVWASASDDFENFKPGTNDDESFSRTVATTTNGIQYLAALSVLLIGTSGDEVTGRSNNFDDPITGANFQTLLASNEGGAPIQPVVGGGAIVYVQHAKRNLMEFAFNPQAGEQGGFVSVDLNRLNPETVEDGIVEIAIQREPERRIHVVLASGKVSVLTYRREEQITAWSTIETDGFIEDVETLPDLNGDRVYFIIRRVINGVAKRFIERLNRETFVPQEERLYVDSGLCFELERPEAFAQPSATTGPVTIDTLEDAFASGDVGKAVWINGGKAVIDTFVSAKSVTATVELVLDSTDFAAPGQWGMNTPVTSLGGLDHLNGETVQIYADKAVLPPQVVSGGQVTFSPAISVACIGLQFTSVYTSLKLAYGSQKGTALLQEKFLRALGLVFFETLGPVRIGGDLDNLDPVVFRTIQDQLGFAPKPATEEVYQSFEGIYDTDPRISIVVDTPTFATVNAMVLMLDEHDRP